MLSRFPISPLEGLRRPRHGALPYDELTTEAWGGPLPHDALTPAGGYPLAAPLALPEDELLDEPLDASSAGTREAGAPSQTVVGRRGLSTMASLLAGGQYGTNPTLGFGAGLLRGFVARKLARAEDAAEAADRVERQARQEELDRRTREAEKARAIGLLPRGSVTPAGAPDPTDAGFEQAVDGVTSALSPLGPMLGAGDNVPNRPTTPLGQLGGLDLEYRAPLAGVAPTARRGAAQRALSPAGAAAQRDAQFGMWAALKSAFPADAALGAFDETRDYKPEYNAWRSRQMASRFRPPPSTRARGGPRSGSGSTKRPLTYEERRKDYIKHNWRAFYQTDPLTKTRKPQQEAERLAGEQFDRIEGKSAVTRSTLTPSEVQEAQRLISAFLATGDTAGAVAELRGAQFSDDDIRAVIPGAMQ